MIRTLGIYADKPTANTGMAIVNANLAHELCRLTDELRVIFFARFGQKVGFAKIGETYDAYEVVDCEGGVWKSHLVKNTIKKYRVDIVYCHDDWWSAKGIASACIETKRPFYFMTPIDSLPIQREANLVFQKARKVFVPNQSYKYIPNGVYLPHAVDWMTFKPVRKKASDSFIFLWIGRDERRKALGRAILAYEKIYKKYDCKFVVRTNWRTPFALLTNQYIKSRRLPIIQDLMSDCPHEYLANIYSACHAYICSSKAGGFEMGTLEANACGLPTLVTDWTFMNENVINGKTGFLIPIEGFNRLPQKYLNGKEKRNFEGRIWGNISIDKLAERMTWMLENQKKAMKIGINGLLWVRKNFKWKDVAAKFFNTIIDDMEEEKKPLY